MKRRVLKGVGIVVACGVLALVGPQYITTTNVAHAITLESTEGSFSCKNGQTLDYTIKDGVLTLSGKGDQLDGDFMPFAYNDSIEKVVFADDCNLVSMNWLFMGCSNLVEVKNIPDTVVDMESAFFGCKKLKEVPKLPKNVKNLRSTFYKCESITEVDFSKFPHTISCFWGAFEHTGLTNVNFNYKFEGKTATTLEMSFCFSECKSLKSLSFDFLNMQNEVRLQACCSNDTNLETVELKGCSKYAFNPGCVNSSNLFSGCSSLKTVSWDGYFNNTIKGLFEDCTQLQTVQCRGCKGIYNADTLSNAFRNCSSLEGEYYIALSIEDKELKPEDIESPYNNFKYAFEGCTDKVTFYFNSQSYVDYFNSLKENGEINCSANFAYFKGDLSEKEETVTENQESDHQTTTVTTTGTVHKKEFTSFKVTSCKKNAKVIKGKVVKGAKITTKIAGKKYSVTADKKGSFTIKLKEKLKAKTTISLTATKSGYKNKTIKVKVK